MSFDKIYARIREIILIAKKAKLASEHSKKGIWRFL